MLADIRALYAKIPRLAIEQPNEPQKLSAAVSVPEVFVEAAGASIDRWPRLEAAAATDAATLRDSFGYALATTRWSWRPTRSHARWSTRSASSGRRPA